NNNVVAGNFVGTDWTGASAIANAGQGLAIQSGASNNRIGTDGNGDGSDVFERNVISGNTSQGIIVQSDNTNNNVIAGNYIGLNAAGTAKVGNGSQGILVQNGPDDTRI